MNPRVVAAIAAGKVAAAASRLLGRGGGTAIAGLAALRIDPGLVRALTSQAGAGAIAVTGTNGKTTTSLMLSRIASAAGLRPLHNRSGSNLMRGVAAMLVDEATLAGAIPDAAKRLAILEVDEATLPEIARSVAPRAIVFTNLFRDQLDRYGEVDTVAAAWERALPNPRPLPRGEGELRMEFVPVIVLNADDPGVAHLGPAYARAGRLLRHRRYDGGRRGRRSCVGLSDVPELRRGDRVHGDVLRAHRALAVSGVRERASGAGRARDAGRASVMTATALTIATPDGEIAFTLPLAGLYNAYNALAAVAGALAMGLPREAIVPALEGFSAAFGRQERFAVDGRDVRVLLGKNPTGLNQVLRTIAGSGRAGRMARRCACCSS